ncbi:MAG: hypothetical protein ACKPE3_34220 [Sphaerospermopsis kisseleviana]
MIEKFLTDKTAFNQLASGNVTVDLTTNDNFSPIKRWEIFSRVRFEYVRPTCTLRSQSAPSVLPCMNPEEKEYGIKSYLQSGLNPNKEAITQLHRNLENPILGSLAEALKRYYQRESVGVPGIDASLFPADYIIVHDLHHVLLGVDTSQKGELAVIAFESGMIQRTEFPILLIEQIEIFVGDLFKEIRSHELMKYWNIGTKAATLVDDWQWWNDLVLPLETVREKYNILGA